MRYLGQFPSEAQVRDAIIPEIEEDEPMETVKYTKFEPYMLKGWDFGYISAKGQGLRAR
jgi:hypothetical protein